MPEISKRYFLNNKKVPDRKYICQGRIIIISLIRDATLIRSSLQATLSAGYQHTPGNLRMPSRCRILSIPIRICHASESIALFCAILPADDFVASFNADSLLSAHNCRLITVGSFFPAHCFRFIGYAFDCTLSGPFGRSVFHPTLSNTGSLWKHNQRYLRINGLYW